MTIIPFIKMQGAGNDYVYINCFETPIETLGDIALLSKKISNRHFGVGSDGLVLIMPSDNGADVRMRMFNADGSEAQMCGNASRCVAKYAFDNNIVAKREITLQTMLNNKHISINTNNSVTVNMGSPSILQSNDSLLIDGKTIDYTSVSMGNPHCVIFVDDTKNAPVESLGSKIEIHEKFPQKTNVEFVHVVDNKNIEMRVWERGAGETLACGTGACATLVASFINGKSSNKATIKLLGGNLDIYFNIESNSVFMTGEAEVVFKGEYILK